MSVGRALCIGVDTSESQSALAAADARALAEVARRQGFEPAALLLDVAATRANVCEKLREAASACAAGDLFMLTFSGHGGRKACAGVDAREAFHGIWVLFDGSFDDAEMRAALAAFKPGVRVLVISDSCNGGVPGHVPVAPVAAVSASVLVLSACGQEQFADAAGLPGHFTTALLRTWHRGRRIFSYRAFYEMIVEAMPAYQQPKYYWLGAQDSRFEAQEPFTV